MLSTYSEHKIQVQSVRDYIKILKDIAEVPSRYPDENSATALLKFVSMPQKRSYDYSLIIITLYGIFESFVEEILGAYLSALSSKIRLYTDLPDTLAKNHLDLSAKLILNTSTKYNSIRKEDIVSNLHSCLNQSDHLYKLNIEAFTQHTANFRIDTIQEFFKLVCIDIRNIMKKNPSLIKFLMEEENYSAEEVETLSDTKYFEILEDLVQRRNLIAHGSNIDELLSLDILDQYSKYILAIIESIYFVIINKYYEIMVIKNIAQELGDPIRVIDNRIICINSSNLHIKIGQILIGKNGRDAYSWGTIESIQLDGNDICEIDEDKAVNIGIGVSFKAKDNYTYYLFSNE